MAKKQTTPAPTLTKEEAKAAIVLLSRSKLGVNSNLEAEIKGYINLKTKLEEILNYSGDDDE